jgi:hypothetical protein
MVELVGQRRQRAAARSADDDLPYHVTGQPVRQDSTRHSQNLRRRLADGSPPGIIRHGQLSRYPGLQHFQQRHRLGQWRILHGLAEGFADHHRELPGLLSRQVHLGGGALDSGGGCLPQCTFLVAAEHQRGQLLAAGIGQQPD